jgi:hypothetical protein
MSSEKGAGANHKRLSECNKRSISPVSRRRTNHTYYGAMFSRSFIPDFEHALLGIENTVFDGDASGSVLKQGFSCKPQRLERS